MVRGSKVKHILALLGLLIALALPLMFLLEDFVRDAIVLPLAYQAWLIGVVLGALPEGCFLMPVVGLAAYLAVRSLQRGPEAPATTSQPTRRTPLGLTRLWLERIVHVSEGTYSRERLEHYVGQFMMRVISYENRLSTREALKMIESGELVVPDGVRRYVDAAFQTGVAPKPGWFARIRLRVRDRIRGREPSRVSMSAIAAQINPALTYVEEELRIEHMEAMSEQQTNL